MNTLYLECYSGISGDMTVAALLDLGANEQALRATIDGMQLAGCHLHTGRVKKCGIEAFDFDVHLAHEHHDHDHDHHDHDHDHHDHHDHDHHDHHDHDHQHDHQHHDHAHEHAHEHRTYADIVRLLDAATLSEPVRALAKKIFGIVAQAEAKVHGMPVDKVGFHEVGAVDSIVDIVGAAFCLHDLGIERVYLSPLYEGTGTVRCQHGIMPVPAPATAEIAVACGLTLQITDNVGEMVTPTGAAIAAAVNAGMPPAGFRILKTGYGAGKKDFPRANLLRAHLIEESGVSAQTDEVTELSCNLDDMTGEQLGFAMERLFEAGALDVWHTPIQMKKNRPGVLLSVLSRPNDAQVLTDCILRHTTTLGVRRAAMQRTLLPRETFEVQTVYGAVQMKRCGEGASARCSVEYESARETALHAGVSLAQVQLAAEMARK